MLPNAMYILLIGFYKHPLKKCIKFVTKVYNIFNLELLFTGNIPRGVFCEQSSQKTRELRRGDLFHIPFFRITTSFKFPAVLHFYSRFLLPDLTHQSPLYG